MAEDEDQEFEGVYDDDEREELVKNDEITPEEEAFMQGYEEEEVQTENKHGDEAYEEAFKEMDGKKGKKK
ncbi:MAG: hypothetical protein ABIH41_01945 [Nanoarchaeota archaeon]